MRFGEAVHHHTVGQRVERPVVHTDNRVARLAMHGNGLIVQNVSQNDAENLVRILGHGGHPRRGKSDHCLAQSAGIPGLFACRQDALVDLPQVGDRLIGQAHSTGDDHDAPSRTHPLIRSDALGIGDGGPAGFSLHKTLGLQSRQGQTDGAACDAV